MKFTDLDLQPNILRALEDMKYEDLTPIQEQTIPHILAGKDVMGLAETGSGKTGACAIPLVQRIDPQLREIQVLVLVPTRELALQYVQEVDTIAKQTGVSPFAVFGGFDIDIQKAKLRHGVHILVATPGRLIDLVWNARLDLSHVRTAVLDEADEMLKMGFIEDVDFIMSCMIQEHQTLLFSATMPSEIERLTKAYLTEPERVQLNKDQIAPQSLNHHFQRVPHRQRQKALLDYIDNNVIKQAILFCNSRDGASDLFKALQGRVPSIEYIHGGLDQGKRTSIFNRFRQMKIQYMVATDVAGRGLDFSHVSHIINYDYPRNAEIYTHRTGRAGRMGREGTAITFIGDRDLHELKGMFRINRIEPIWDGEEPDLSKARGRSRSGGSGRGGGGRRNSGQNRSGGGNRRRRPRSNQKKTPAKS